MAKSCRNLHTILLRRCVLVDDKCIETIVNNCQRLAYLNLGNCPLITDKSLESLGKCCNNLKSVNFTATKVLYINIYNNNLLFYV
jgi:EIN3-binding F-box protein